MERLKIPENIPLRWEMWRGFGTPEAIITGCTLAVSIACALLYASLHHSDPLTPVKVMSGIILVLFCTISTVTKLEYNRSILDYILQLIRFKREQQQFVYCQEEVLLPYADKKEENK